MNEDRPRVGAAAADDGDPECAFSPEPGAPKCTNLATMHLRVEDKHYGVVGLPTCQRHYPIAVAAGRLLQEHAYEGWCGFPASVWSIELNVCLMDDTGVEPALREYATADA